MASKISEKQLREAVKVEKELLKQKIEKTILKHNYVHVLFDGNIRYRS